MRVAFAVLLLVNLLYFAWAAWLKPQPVEVVSVAPPAPRLILASEAPAAPPTRCVTVGPFDNAEAVQQATQILVEGGYQPATRGGVARVLDGYWVSLPSPGVGREEQRLLQRLRRGGVDDAYAIDDANLGRRVSLGIFSEKERADTQAARASRIGVEAEIAPREREQNVTWVDFQLRTDTPEISQSRFKMGAQEVEFRPCPTAAEPAASSEPTAAGTTGGPEPAQGPAADAPQAP
jgi:hypothetical protein